MAEFPIEINGQKYDIKKFLRDHPGGVNTLNYYKGTSVLKAMEKFQHSTNAYHILNDFKVGQNGSEIKDSNLTGSVSANGRIITKEESTRDLAEIAFLEELESRLDWSKPLLSQLEAIAPHYDRWVNTAVYRRCLLFANPWLERLTYTPWYWVPLFWVPIILYVGVSQFFELVACGDSCTSNSLTSRQYMFHISVGLLIWTALEYILHRWVFHMDPGSSLTLIKAHFLIHGIHHKMPFDGLRQVFPPVPAFIIAWFLYACGQPWLSHPLVTFTGAITGYLTYDMIHYYVHHGSPQDGSYLYTMKRYHSNHHFVNHDKAFGISCKIWDYVFRTLVQVRKLGIVLRW